MSQPLFLYKPSEESARVSGLGRWWDCLSEQARLIEAAPDESLGNGAVFVSFDPIRSKADTHPHMRGSVERWLFVDDREDVNAAVRWANEAGVERILYAKRPDEMDSQVWPSTIEHLKERGVWLPPSRAALEDLSGAEEAREFSGRREDDRCVLFVRDGPLDQFSGQAGGRNEAGDLGSSASPVARPEGRRLIEKALRDAGVLLRFVSLQDVLDGSFEGCFGSAILDAVRLEAIIQFSTLAMLRDVRFGLWQPAGPNLLSLAYLQLRQPDAVGLKSRTLRGAVQAVHRVLHFAKERSLLADKATGRRIMGGNGGAAQRQKLFSDARPFEPALMARFLSTKSGRCYLAWLSQRLDTDRRAIFLPIYVSSEFFREREPFSLLIRRSRQEYPEELEEPTRELDRLLSRGLRLSGGKRPLYAYYSAWTGILLGNFGAAANYNAIDNPVDIENYCRLGLELILALRVVGEHPLADRLLKGMASKASSAVGEDFGYANLAGLLVSGLNEGVGSGAKSEDLQRSCRDGVSDLLVAIWENRKGNRAAVRDRLNAAEEKMGGLALEIGRIVGLDEA